MSKNKAIILLLAAVLQGASLIQAASQKLNVVLIMADDVGYECFSAYGSKEFSTLRLKFLDVQDSPMVVAPFSIIRQCRQSNYRFGRARLADPLR
jgi:hypothetical protein